MRNGSPLLLVLGALLAAAPAVAQSTVKVEEPPVEQSCRVVPDTAVVPTPGQIRERRELRVRLDSLGRANGVAAPTGLLLVDVDSARRGKVIFIETNYPQPVVDAAPAPSASTSPPSRPGARTRR